jgi:hypothetical protein
MFRSHLPMICRTGISGLFPAWCLIVLSLLGSTPSAAAAKGSDSPAGSSRTVGIVTILQGHATVIHGLSQFDALEGVRLFADDLVRTDKEAFVRVEYEDKTWLELGPDTVMQISHPASRRGKAPALYLMAGWLKVGCNEPAAGTHQSMSSIGIDLLDLSGIIVVRANKDSHEIFAEQGTARWINRAARAAEPISLNKGDFLSASASSSAMIQPRPSADFLAAMPRAYRDSLPIRYAVYSGRPVTGANERAFSYSEVQSWLDAEPQVRKQFLVTWRRKLQDPAFREALDGEMALHHEWDPILHPEKYLPIEPAQPAPLPQSPAVTSPPPAQTSPMSAPKAN